MRTALAGFLVDTNILVYAYDRSDGDKRQHAIDVLETVGIAGTGILLNSGSRRILCYSYSKNTLTASF